RSFYAAGDMENVYVYGAAGSALGTSIGVLVALLFMIALFFMYRPRAKSLVERDVSGVEDSYQE
ncbi:MAG TPA: polysaccharide biosynthesis protein, partial [Lachnospiraceae bacterium]|nr:polysaccharide biosynthesis protein [Lachnospiraceae bacterium]